MVRGQNKEFLYGMIFIFKKNYNIIIDKHEIDLKLSYGENFNQLLNKFKRCGYGQDY